MFRLIFALVALAWSMAFASDDGDEPPADDQPSSPPSDAKHSDKDLDYHKGAARKQGRESGATAERERLAGIYGVEVDKLDDAIKEAAEARRKEQSDSQRMEAERDSANQRADKAEKRVSELEAAERERGVADAIRSAAAELGYKGKAEHIERVVDRNKVEEKENGFDAKAAVKAERDAGFPGFEEDRLDNPDTPPAGSRGSGGANDKSPARQWAERQARRRAG